MEVPLCTGNIWLRSSSYRAICACADWRDVSGYDQVCSYEFGKTQDQSNLWLTIFWIWNVIRINPTKHVLNTCMNEYGTFHCWWSDRVVLFHTLKKICNVHIEPWLISNLMHKILIYLYIIHLLKSSTCFEHYPAHLQEVYAVIVYMQPLVSSLCAGDCPVHRLRKNRCTEQSRAESDDTRSCVHTITT